MVEGARLESVYTPKAYRGFESLPLCKKIEILSNLLITEKREKTLFFRNSRKILILGD